MRFADSIVWKNKSFVWKGRYQEKNCIFAYIICRKRKRKQRTKIGGIFFYEVEGHLEKLSSFGRAKKKRPKMSLTLFMQARLQMHHILQRGTILCFQWADLSKTFLVAENSLKLAKYWISCGTMCHMALSELNSSANTFMSQISPPYCRINLIHDTNDITGRKSNTSEERHNFSYGVWPSHAAVETTSSHATRESRDWRYSEKICTKHWTILLWLHSREGCYTYIWKRFSWLMQSLSSVTRAFKLLFTM